MKDNLKLQIIRKNVSDGLKVPFKPFDDNYAISDLKVKLNLFDLALQGLKEESSHSIIEHKDVLNLAHFWLNISINLEQALSLLEYADAALDPRDDIVDFEDLHHWEFPIGRVKSAIEKYRQKNGNYNA